jgi:hypothetical protein
MRSLLAQGRREDRALMFLILACGIIFVSQWPVISREAALDAAGAPLQARLAITFFAWLMIWPLAFYGIGSLTHLVMRAFGGTGQRSTPRGWRCSGRFWPQRPHGCSTASCAASLGRDRLKRGRVGLVLAFVTIWGICLREAEFSPEAEAAHDGDPLARKPAAAGARHGVEPARRRGHGAELRARSAQALWLMFALVIVLSLLLREIVALFAGISPPRGRSWVRCKLPHPRPRDGGFLCSSHPRRAPDRRFFGGTGSFEEARFWSSGCSSS